MATEIFFIGDVCEDEANLVVRIEKLEEDEDGKDRVFFSTMSTQLPHHEPGLGCMTLVAFTNRFHKIGHITHAVDRRNDGEAA